MTRYVEFAEGTVEPDSGEEVTVAGTPEAQ
jgi:hypothetical protein